MANTRKLQGEIDRLMKKVQEGIEEFDGILSKVYSATSANQKEKYEQDLKREIKKLQRSRDQIKAWIASSEVKQKNPLIEARKLIETKMEQFKTCEKDSKTKAFSKEGLSMAQSDKDEKHDTRKWIKKSLKELQTQIDTFEGELDQIPPKKRSGNSRVQELTDVIDHHKFHINKLEKVLRNLENDTITVDQVEDLKDTLDYYLESNQDPEFMFDDTVYDHLNLKEEDDKPVIPANLLRSSLDDGSNPPSDDESEDLSQGSTTSTKSETKPTTPVPAPTPAPAPVTAPAPVPAKKTAAEPPKTANPLSGLTANTAPSAPTKKDEPAVPKPVEKKTTAPAEPPKPTKPLTELFKQPAQTSTPPPEGPPAQRKGSASTPPPMAVTPTAQPKGKQATQPPAQAPVAVQPSPATPEPKKKEEGGVEQPFNRANPTIQYSQFARNATTVTQTLQQAVANQNQQAFPPLSATVDRRHAPTPPLQPQVPAPMQTQPPAQAVPQTVQPTMVQPPVPQPQPQQQEVAQPKQNILSPSQFPPLGNQQPEVAPIEPKEPIVPVNIDRYEETSSEPFDAAHSIESALVDSFAQQPQVDLQSAMAMLEASMRNVPDPMDSERPKTYTPRNPWNAPQYYPSIPLQIFDNPTIFEKFDTDTLFFIFYYQQGTYQQYLAAKELKKQSWRYHKKYLTWFQRHEEPKEITNDYEQGTYVYFDYETGWCQRKKTEFTFEYRFLEDYD